MALVESRLIERDEADRAAWFTCALAVAWPRGPVVVFEGRVDGSLTFPPRGRRGFGYDPIFLPRGRSQTFGEMPPAAKDVISHRAKAFEALKACLF
jgi:XTP/dITP diphosphohydrolase